MNLNDNRLIIKTLKSGDQKVFSLVYGHSCISPWQYNHVIQRLWTL